MFYTIYKITNLVNNKYYIGKHQTKELDDGYMGSGKLLKLAIRKYGIENFKKEILFILDDEEDMNLKEKELVILCEEAYNLCVGGKGGFSYINRTITREERILRSKNVHIKHPTLASRMGKITAKKTSDRLKMFHAEGKITAPPSWLGKTHLEESKIKISNSNKGKNTGIKNSQFGSCWITNGKENKKIKKDNLNEWISLGYKKGRI